MGGVYVPHAPTAGVLYGVMRTNPTDFLAAIEARTDAACRRERAEAQGIFAAMGARPRAAALDRDP